jgi:hypothetical protein
MHAVRQPVTMAINALIKSINVAEELKATFDFDLETKVKFM